MAIYFKDIALVLQRHTALALWSIYSFIEFVLACSFYLGIMLNYMIKLAPDLSRASKWESNIL